MGKIEISKILKAMKATEIPASKVGLWSVRKYNIEKYILSPNKKQVITPGCFTKLSKMTWATRHLGGECVMADYDMELKKHLQFILVARGNIIVSGLGLGCIVRGLLCKPEVTSIEVLEKEKAVIDLVSPYMPKDSRLKIYYKDALRFSLNGKLWDYAWHDIWTENNKGLQKKHAELIVKFMNSARYQGAWNFPRELKKLCELIG